jgi:hypothetical protein
MEEIMGKEVLLRLEPMHIIAELTDFLRLSLQEEHFISLSIFFCDTLFFRETGRGTRTLAFIYVYVDIHVISHFSSNIITDCINLTL